VSSVCGFYQKFQTLQFRETKINTLAPYIYTIFCFSVPPDITDEVAGLVSFSEEYKRRYGSVHPHFLLGTFEEAVDMAFKNSAQKVLRL